MLNLLVFYCLFFCHLVGVLGDQVKSVSVIEGDSVTLHSDAELQANEDIMWRFGPDNFLIAEIYKGAVNFSTNNVSVRFKDRLELNNKTGSLTITDIKSNDAGVYQLRRKTICRFNITVYARLPIPVISRDSPRNRSLSVSKCVLLCSIMNVALSAVSLSWYNGNSLLSSIRVSGQDISLSLQMDCLNGSYSCVVAYSFTNKTTHLTNPELCQACPDSRIILISAAAAGSLLFLVAVIGILWICWKHRKTHQVQSHEEEEEEVVYAEPTFFKRDALELEVKPEAVFTAGTDVKQ